MQEMTTLSTPVVPESATTQPNLTSAVGVPAAHSKLPLLLGGIGLFVVGGIAGYYLCSNTSPCPKCGMYPEAVASPMPVASASTQPISSPVVDPTAGWDSYAMPSAGVAFKLPPRVASVGTLVEEVASGEVGTQLCGQFVDDPSQGKTMGGLNCSTKPNPYLFLGTVSTNYAAGRDGSFFDLNGFTQENGVLKLKTITGVLSDSPWDDVTEVTNQHGVEVLIIDGELDPDGGPNLQNALGDRIGVLVNTVNTTYTGMGFMFVRDGGLTKEEINQFVQTIQVK